MQGQNVPKPLNVKDIQQLADKIVEDTRMSNIPETFNVGNVTPESRGKKHLMCSRTILTTNKETQEDVCIKMINIKPPTSKKLYKQEVYALAYLMACQSINSNDNQNTNKNKNTGNAELQLQPSDNMDNNSSSTTGSSNSNGFSHQSQLIGHGHDKQYYYIITNCYHVRSLSDYIKRTHHKKTMKHCLKTSNLIRQIIIAIKYLHDNNIVFGNINADNFLVQEICDKNDNSHNNTDDNRIESKSKSTRKREVKLILTNYEKSILLDTYDANKNKTENNGLCQGSVHYMAPETVFDAWYKTWKQNIKVSNNTSNYNNRINNNRTKNNTKNTTNMKNTQNSQNTIQTSQLDLCCNQQDSKQNKHKTENDGSQNIEIETSENKSDQNDDMTDEKKTKTTTNTKTKKTTSKSKKNLLPKQTGKCMFGLTRKMSLRNMIDDRKHRKRNQFAKFVKERKNSVTTLMIDDIDGTDEIKGMSINNETRFDDFDDIDDMDDEIDELDLYNKNSRLKKHGNLDLNLLKCCDVWSIGIIAYIIMTGKAPFAGRDRVSIFESIITRDWKQCNEDDNTDNSILPVEFQVESRTNFQILLCYF